MAKIRKFKLSWGASNSKHVFGYKLYWSRGAGVSYDSKFIKVGNVTEISLPDEIILSDGPVMFGVTAIDKEGNESDMAKIKEPYHMHVPKPPEGISLQPLEAFKLVDSSLPEPKELHPVTAMPPEQNEEPEDLARAIEGNGYSQPTRMKYYDDVGYRKTS